jgi:hypothetical protein
MIDKKIVHGGVAKPKPILKTTGIPRHDLGLLESAARSGFPDAAVEALSKAYDAASAAGLTAVLMRRLDPDAAADLHDIFAARLGLPSLRCLGNSQVARRTALRQ